MKRLALMFGFLVALSFGAFANPITNPSFESVGSDGLPTGWSVGGDSADAVVLASFSTLDGRTYYAPDGDNFLGIRQGTASNYAPGGRWSYATLVSQSFSTAGIVNPVLSFDFGLLSGEYDPVVYDKILLRVNSVVYDVYDTRTLGGWRSTPWMVASLVLPTNTTDFSIDVAVAGDDWLALSFGVFDNFRIVSGPSGQSAGHIAVDEVVQPIGSGGGSGAPSVPEPQTLGLLGIGIAVLLFVRRKPVPV